MMKSITNIVLIFLFIFFGQARAETTSADAIDIKVNEKAKYSNKNCPVIDRADINLKSKNVRIVSEEEFQKLYKKCDNRTALDAGMAIVAAPIVCGLVVCVINLITGKEL